MTMLTDLLVPAQLAMPETIAATTLAHYLFVSAAMFAMGLVGFLTRKNMIVMFLCTELMFQGAGLALIAFGRGEWLGVGLGASVQKLFYLPHANNDFLLAVIAEELGVAGVAAVVVLFCVLVWKAFAIAKAAELSGERFGARLAQGVGLLLAILANRVARQS